MKKTLPKLFLASSLAIVSNLIINVPENLKSEQLSRLSYTLSQPKMAFARDQTEGAANFVYQKAVHSVVMVRTTGGSGSGFIVSSDGLIITNAHVVENGPTTVTVVLNDGKQLAADVIGFDSTGQDLAILKVYGQQNLPFLKLAKLGSIRVGDRAFAIGSPFGRKDTFNSFSDGIVSRIDSVKGLIQTNADINPGNSGGPLLNSRAEVIGVNTSIITHNGGNSGIGFAISTAKIRAFLEMARAGNLASNSTHQKTNSKPLPPQALALNGQILSGSLGNRSYTLENGSYYNLYVFKGKQGQKVTIEMKSQDVDPFLRLLRHTGQDPNGQPSFQLIATNDDIGAHNFNAKITRTLPTDGTYVVLANTFDAKETGTYQLSALTGSMATSSSPNASKSMRFFCGKTYEPASENTLPTTLAWIPDLQSKVAIIRWKSEYFEQFDLDPKRRCDKASERFHQAFIGEGKRILTASLFKKTPVVCLVSRKGDLCGKDYLFALKPTDNPANVLNELLQVLKGRGSGPIYQSRGVVYIDIEEELSKSLEEEDKDQFQIPVLQLPAE